MAVNFIHPTGYAGPEFVAASRLLRSAVDQCRKAAAMGTNLKDGADSTPLSDACGAIGTAAADLMLGRLTGFLATFDAGGTPDGKNFIDTVG